MTRQADFKRRVRARMAKTGESYAAARGRLLAGHPGTTPEGSPLHWMPEALHISGQADQVALNGIDRWIGGVHLRGHHVPWRWDDGTESIAAQGSGVSP